MLRGDEILGCLSGVTALFQEPHTLNLKKLSVRDGAVVAWWGTAVECYSALARLRREEALTPADETQARTVLHALMAAWTEIEPSIVVREQAGRVLLLHSLRAADAMQLAAAIVWANGQASGHEFVCLDHRLREAAQREGFTVLPKQLLS